jgi:uncharacterized membrane protein
VTTSVNKRLFITWLILTAITLLYFWIDRATNTDGVLTASTVVTVSAIFLALMKVRIIMREFMDVRAAPPVLRSFTDAWIVLMGLALLGTYFVGRTLA